MKIAVINKSGNIGKTVLAANILQPRIPTENYCSIESSNLGADADGVEAEIYKGKNFGQFMDEWMLLDDGIADIGSGDNNEFIRLMGQYDGSHEEFDYFVIPTIRDNKVEADTIGTINALQAMGVEQNRIRLLFNRVDLDSDIEHDFAALFGLAISAKNCIANPKACLSENEVYGRLKGSGKTLPDVLADDTDYRALMRKTKDQDKKLEYRDMVAIQRLARSAAKEHDAMFEALFADA